MKQMIMIIVLLLSFITANEKTLPVDRTLPKVEQPAKKVVRSLEVLHPAFRNKVILVIQLCNKAGVEVVISETYRDSVRQDSLFNKGRRVTNLRGGYSKHQYGLAIDLMPKVRTKANWRKIAEIGKSLGLRSGYYWKSPWDPGHLEYKFPFEELLIGNKPTIPDTVYIPI